MTCPDCHGHYDDDDMSREELIALIRIETMLKLNAAVVAHEANRALQMVFGLPMDVAWLRLDKAAQVASLDEARLILEGEGPTPVTLQDRVRQAIINTMVP